MAEAEDRDQDRDQDRDHDPGRAAFAQYRRLLDAQGFHPSRRLGQNFLLEKELHRLLVDAVGPGVDDLVLEVGAGLGFLTREILGRGCRVLAVEVDARLVRVLETERQGFPAGGSGLQLLHADILQSSRLNPEVLEALARARDLGPPATGPARFLVLANLPYAIAGPLLAEFCLMQSPPEEMALMLQLELGQRLVARPRSREYSALSVLMQLAFEIRLLRRVGAQVFRPRPAVDSAMLHLARRQGGSLDLAPACRRELGQFLRGLFSARRKKLRNARILSQLSRAWPQAVSHLAERRPDSVPPETLLALWHCLRDDLQESS